MGSVAMASTSTSPDVIVAACCLGEQTGVEDRIR